MKKEKFEKGKESLKEIADKVKPGDFLEFQILQPSGESVFNFGWRIIE